MGASRFALALPVVAVLFPGTGHARALTLDEALALAEAVDPGIRAGHSRVEAAKAGRERAGIYPYNPELEAGYRTARIFGEPEDSIGLGVSQTIELAGQTGARREVAGKGVAATELAVEVRRRTLRADLAERFYRLLLARELLALRREQVALAERFSSIAARLLQAGSIAPVERMQVDLDRVRTETAQEEAAGDVSAAETRLRTMLRLPPEETIEPVGAAPSERPVPDAAALRAVAAKTRPDLRALLAEALVHEAEADLARREAWPDLTLALTWERETSALGSLAETDYFLGLRFAIPLPLANRNQGAAAQAAALAAARRADADAVGLELEVEVREALARAASADRRLASLDAVMPQAIAAMAATQQAFEAGQLRVNDTLSARERVLRLREDQIAARAAAVAARLALARAAGLEVIP